RTRCGRTVRPVPRAGTPRRRRGRPGPGPGRRRAVPRAAVPGTAGWWSAAAGPACRSLGTPFQDGIDGITGGAPGGGPLRQDLPAHGGDAVAAARRARVGRL